MRDNITNEFSEQTMSSIFTSLLNHLDGLRKVLIKVVMVVAITSTISYFYAGELVHFITLPAGKLYYLNPAEAFFTYLKVSVFFGFLIALPVVLYQVWSFIMPALTKQEYKIVTTLLPVSVLLFFIGLSFSYFLVLPAGIKFFMGFATDSLQPMFSLGQYLSFVVSFLLPFGFIFEVPIIIFVLAKAGIITSDFLKAKRKTTIVLSFVVGAIISPTPDVFSQTMIAIPLLILYEFSLGIVKYILHK